LIAIVLDKDRCLLAKLDVYRTYDWLKYSEDVDFLQEQTEHLLGFIN